MTQLYARDSIDIWHAVAFVDDDTRRVRVRCAHNDFIPAQPPITKRPRQNEYCAGCLGVEEREAEKAKKQAEEAAAKKGNG